MAAIMARLHLDTSRSAHTRQQSSKGTAQHDPPFQRAASFTYLPTSVSTYDATNSVRDSKQDYAEEVLDVSTPDSSGWTTPEEGLTMSRRDDVVFQLQQSPKLAENDQCSIASSIARSSRAGSLDTAQTSSTTATTPAYRLSVDSSLLLKGNRDSLVESITSTPTQSRSPSPEKPTSHTLPALETKDDGPTRRKSLRRRLTSKITKEKHVDLASNSAAPKVTEHGDEPRRRPTVLRIRSRPSSGPFKNTLKDEESRSNSATQSTPRVPHLPKAFSTDRLPTFRFDSTPAQTTPVPKFLTSERIVIGPLLPKRKDELWNVFRQLDADFGRFASKSSALKASVVRSSLLPFLRAHATHAANKTVRPEELDRRTNILNKWWSGLLEMLHGRNNQSISGTDRPCILDGICGIMERPEWRLAPSPLCPLVDRADHAQPSNDSRSSLNPDASHLAGPIHQNVRNTFVYNLSTQMAIVVEKMACRQASASLVAFGGKACAFAFMFVPGMADVLVRLWNIPADLVRRVIAEHGLGKFDNIRSTTAGVVSEFPPALQALAFESLASYRKKLRQPAMIPSGTGDLDWWGPWLERWSGRESDLFYVFTKHFHILTADFMPTEHNTLDAISAPGAVMVQAQMLVNLELTVHRDSQQGQEGVSIMALTPFDDLLGDPDAIGSALPMSPTNVKRTMAENRLIMLVREFLSEKSSRYPKARHVFAQAFNGLLQAAVRSTSVFEHAACYTILDLLEEALQLLVRYEQSQGDQYELVDMTFWQSVWRGMIASQNTMTEIRLYSFLYTTWTTLACNDRRRHDFCIEFLLDAEIFDSRFNHWCPMIRAYYMRLLCWRVGRFDGHASRHDQVILETLWQRLQTTWSHYLFLKEEAEQKSSILPATNPCTPAPSRRLLIIRTDKLTMAEGLLSFDGILSPPISAQKRMAPSGSTDVDSRPTSSRSGSDSDSIDLDERGIGVFLRRMIGPSKKKSGLREMAASNQARQAGSAPEAPAPPSRPESRGQGTENSSSYRPCSFRFSLEYNAGAKGLPHALKLQPPRLPLPAQQFLMANSTAIASPTIKPVSPPGHSHGHAKYAGRALAEWTMVVCECHSFFERRKKEGATDNRHVETPTLGVEVFRRPG